MITFYFGLHTGKTGDTPEHKAEDVFELDIDYPEGLKLLRCITHIFKDWAKLRG